MKTVLAFSGISYGPGQRDWRRCIDNIKQNIRSCRVKLDSCELYQAPYFHPEFLPISCSFEIQVSELMRIEGYQSSPE